MAQTSAEVESLTDLKNMIGQLATDFFVAKPKKDYGYTPKQLERLWYPKLTDAEEKYIDTHLGRINVTIGANRNGPAMVLWPSLMMRGTMWNGQYEYFRKDYYLVLIDSPGIGKSEDLRKLIDLRDCCDMLVELLDALRIKKCIFGGNSWGAMMAAVIPAWIPDRLIGTIVTNGTASHTTTVETIMMSARANVLQMNATMPTWWTDISQTAFAGKTAESSRPEFMAYVGCVSREDPKSVAWAIKGILLGRKDYHSICNTIKDVPVLVIAGEEDRQFSVPMVKSMADAIPTSTFIVAKGVAHLASRENPELINKHWEDWLSKIGALKK